MGDKKHGIHPTNLIKLLGFHVKRRLKGFEVGDEPYFDTRARDIFAEKLAACSCYLEYGSGGSTVSVAKTGKPFLSVDNDAVFLSCVGKKIGGLQSNQRLLYVDTGLTGPWGVPVLRKLDASRKSAWRAYAWEPWNVLSGLGLQPDLILVDGRFRVASALVSILNAMGRPVTLLVDDYRSRPNYKVIEQFAQLDELTERMAVFRVEPCDAEKLRVAIAEHETDFS